MFTRKLIVAAAGLLLLGTTPLIGNATASTTNQSKVVSIVGKDSFAPNAFLLNTFHFQPGLIFVHQGQQVTFVNKTTDGHTMTLVAKADLPRNVNEVFQCKLCKAVNGIYQPAGSHGPAGVQIDSGHLTDDDSEADADMPDPAVPPGVPFTALVEDFDTVSHSNSHAAPTIGDSSIIGPTGQPGASRTIVVTAPPGTVLHYFCTFHAWMQATIVVIK